MAENRPGAYEIDEIIKAIQRIMTSEISTDEENVHKLFFSTREQ